MSKSVAVFVVSSDDALVRSGADLKYARKPWLYCDHCGRNTWRKIKHGGGRNYCNETCAQAAYRERALKKRPRYRRRDRQRWHERRAQKLAG